MEVIQSFEPIPLYEIMEMLGYVHYTEKQRNMNITLISTDEEKGNVEDAPERPAVITNYPMIDEKLGELAVEFWDMTWKSENDISIITSGFFFSLPMPSVPGECGRLCGNC